MVKNKKKAPWRPRTEFISHKPRTKIKSWPWRPRKDTKDKGMSPQPIAPEISSYVAKSVDKSKTKDMIILLLFLLSFALFVVSLYVTFIQKKDISIVTQQEIAAIANVETGNIDYSQSSTIEEPEVNTIVEKQEIVQATIQNLTQEQQLIMDLYQAVNNVDMDMLYTLTDARLEESNVFKTYYSRRWLTNFSDGIIAPKIVVTNIQEVATTSTNPSIKNFEYTLEYMLANNQQKFTEERATTLIKKGKNRKIGKLMCETKWCSTMPFFNPEKYK